MRSAATFSYSIDWLSLIIPDRVPLLEMFAHWDWKHTGKGRYGYKNAFTSIRNGIRLQMDGQSEGMGQNLVATGDSLRTLRLNASTSDLGLLDVAFKQGGHASRIDVACDVFGGNINPTICYLAWQKGALVTSAKTVGFIRGGRIDAQGETLYIGRRQSQRMARIYDKGIEQGQGNPGKWIRVELELKDKQARSAGKFVAQHGIQATFKGQCKKFIKWQHPDWQAMLVGDAAAPEPIVRKDTKTRMWLLGTIAKTLARECVTDAHLLNDFLDAVAEFSI